jgi:hypothetical protein
MTPTTKDTRRIDWKRLNFAGSIDWAVDLQAFTGDDMNVSPDRPESGEGCVSGRDSTVNSEDLCEFSCKLGFCPDSLCTCIERGPLQDLPRETLGVNVMAWDEYDVDLNRLCKFACKYDYCPGDVCKAPEPEEFEDPNSSDSFNTTEIRLQAHKNCVIFKDKSYQYAEASKAQCYDDCKDTLEQAKKDNRISNYGCIGFFPLEKSIPWFTDPGSKITVAPGKCFCDNGIINEIVGDVLEALPAIAQVSLAG